MTTSSAIVVGAGLAGLTAAYRLRQAGWRVTVLEKEATPGGRVRTIRLDDCLIDLGATVMLGSYRQTFELIRQLGLEREVVRVCGSMVVPREGRLHRFDLAHPLAGLLRTSLLNTSSKLALMRLLAPFLRSRRRLGFTGLGGAAGLDQETLAQFCGRTMPAEVYDYLLNPMLKFLYLHDGRRGSLIELLWWLNSLGLGPVYSFRRGAGTLIDALARVVDVRCNAEVLAVHADGSGAVIDVDFGSRRERLSADRCLVTAPAPAAVRIAAEALGTSQTGLLRSRVYDRSTVVSFCTRRRPTLDALMVQVPDAVSDDLATLVFQHRLADGRAPPTNGVVNAYFMHDWSQRHAGDDIVMVMEAARSTVRRLVPEVDDIAAWHVHRWTHTAAIGETGACARIRAFADEVDDANPVRLIGDYLAQSSLNVAVCAANAVAGEWVRAITSATKS